MRILLISNFFPPSHNAGTETYTYGLARAFQEAGHLVHVVCAGTFHKGDSCLPRATTDIVDGVSVTRLHFNWQRAPDIFMNLADNAGVGQWLTAYLQENRPDIVHVVSCDTLSPRVITVAKAMGLPVIVTLTDFWFLCMRHTLLKGDGTLCNGPQSAWGCLQCLAHDAKVYTIPRKLLPETVVRPVLEWASKKPALTHQRGMRGVLGDVPLRQSTVRAALLRADVIISPSAFLREMFIRNGYPVERILVSPHGHDFGWLPHDRTKLPSAGLRIGYVGQIEPLKGVDILIQAFTMLNAPEATLTVHGDDTRNPAYTAELRALARGDHRIRFVGPFARAQRGEVLRRLDVVVVPSRWYENAPLVIAEAFAMHTPVIAANLGGMAEAVRDDVDGLLFAPEDAQDLTRQLQRIADNPNVLDQLRANIRVPRSVTHEAREMLQRYHEISAANVV